MTEDLAQYLKREPLLGFAEAAVTLIELFAP
jgi:hypothetical protein